MVRSKRWVFALGILALSTSCFDASERHVPVLDLYDSHLITPSGPVSFEMDTDPANPGILKNADLRIRVQVPDFRVIVGLFSGRQWVFVHSQTRDLMIDLVEGRSWYRLNAEPPVPLTVTGDHRPQESGPSKRPVTLAFDLSGHPFNELDIAVFGGTLEPSRLGQIRAVEDDTHYLYLPFTVDGETYAVNLTFSLGISTYKAVGAPGMP